MIFKPKKILFWKLNVRIIFYGFIIFLTPLFGFWLLLSISIIIALSSQAYFYLWASLELNIISALPLMNSSDSFFSSEISLKYFISQSIASILFIFFIAWGFLSSSRFYLPLLVFAMLFKLGLPPFHRWLLNIILIRPYKTIILLLFVQKFIPLHIISTLSPSLELLIYPALLSFVVLLLSLKSIFSMRTGLIISAWGNTIWILISVSFTSIWLVFLLIYGIILISAIFLLDYFNLHKLASLSDTIYLVKIPCILNFLNLAGLPPLTGFFAKLVLLKMLVSFVSIFWVLLLLATALSVLFAYIVLTYYAASSPFSRARSLNIRLPPLIYFFLALNWLAFPLVLLIAP